MDLLSATGVRPGWQEFHNAVVGPGRRLAQGWRGLVAVASRVFSRHVFGVETSVGAASTGACATNCHGAQESSLPGQDGDGIGFDFRDGEGAAGWLERDGCVGVWRVDCYFFDRQAGGHLDGLDGGDVSGVVVDQVEEPAALVGLGDQVGHQEGRTADLHREVVPGGPADRIGDFLPVLGELPEAVIDGEVVTHFGERAVELHGREVNHAAFLEFLANGGSRDLAAFDSLLVGAGADLGVDEAAETGLNAQPSPFIIEAGEAGGHQATAIGYETADGSELVVGEALRIREDDDTILREVRQVLVEDQVEGDPGLDERLLGEDGAQLGAGVVVGDGGIRTQNGHGGSVLRGGVQLAMLTVEVDVAPHPGGKGIVARVADGLIEGQAFGHGDGIAGDVSQ